MILDDSWEIGGSFQVLDAKSNVFTRIFVVAFFLYPGQVNPQSALSRTVTVLVSFIAD